MTTERRRQSRNTLGNVVLRVGPKRLEGVNWLCAELCKNALDFSSDIVCSFTRSPVPRLGRSGNSSTKSARGASARKLEELHVTEREGFGDSSRRRRQVHRDPEDPNSIIESYQFKFKYTADGPKLDILSKNKQVSLQDTKKASILLIRKLFVLMQSLEILPNDVSLTMKLFYYDEVTPPEYQPPGFKQGECDAVWFEGTPVHFKVGDVPTPFHMMKVRVTTEKETMEQLEKENMLNEETETSVQGMEEVKSILNDRNSPFYQNITAHSELQRSVTNEQSFSESEKEIKQLVAKAAELDVSGKRLKLRKVLMQKDDSQDNGIGHEEPQKLSTTQTVKAVRAKKTISELHKATCESATLQEKITKRRRKN
ncbi:HORMA domain-containing protein 1-like [Rhincodon typus]|uniref:HORMA domain-containing protein 1-like n=1 Tax=Rhincodon typus TaxID=259920 RepID=UPI0020304551|nr:HORMA domain-containing protein 1-like [Rhincodon typus]